MNEILMIIQIIVSVLMIMTYVMYDSKENISTDNEIRETGKNAFLSKSMKVLSVLFFALAIGQLIIK